jgi:CPA1 family monovalent cation:H+ antiporter
MIAVHQFELILLLIAASVVLTLVARRLGLPQAGALVLGGLALAVAPGMPNLVLNPDLVLVLFLPPLLLLSAYFTDWRALRADIRIVVQLAVGAVVFTTLAVGWVTHLVAPQLPLSACFALGAIVSPPDAVAAKAAIKGLRLPVRTVTLLEAESLLNDATGLVLYRLTVVAALTGAFSGAGAATSFVVLVVGGVALGLACGFAASAVIGRILDGELGVIAGFLAAWGSYILGDALHVSSVLATVACGIVMGWRQHALIDAEQRLHSHAVWSVISFVLESLIFILIGLSLRSVFQRLSHSASDLRLIWQVGAVILAVIIARFVWIMLSAYGLRAAWPALRRRDPYPAIGSTLVMSWAGMRGVVSLAAALALPEAFPGRDLILVATFAVILVTVLVQGSTLGPLIRLFRFETLPGRPRLTLSESETRRRVVTAQVAALERISLQADGSHRHPRLLEQYRFRLGVISDTAASAGALGQVRRDHFDALLGALAGGREELLDLHRKGEIDGGVLRAIESELDADELRARQLLHASPMG